MRRALPRLAFLLAVLLPALLFLAAPLAAQGGGGLQLEGYLENLTAYRIAGEEEVSERRNTFQLELEKRWGRWSLHAIGRARSETELEPEAEEELDLRELYLSRRGPRSRLALGRQQVVWGKTDGLRLLDIVNPLDLREFILEDFVSSRIPLWMLNAELYFGEQSLQLLVIPDLTFNDLAAPGGEFSIGPILAPGALPVVRPTAEPGGGVSEWEYGLKWAGRAGAWDLTVNALYGWGDTPVPFQRPLPGPAVELVPRITRRRTVGASADVPAGPVVLRFETTFTPDEHRAVAAGGEGGFARHDLLSYAVGLDWIRGDWLLSPQLFQDVLLDPHPTLLGDDTTTYATLLLQRQLLQSRLTLRLFVLHGFESAEEWIAPTVSYELFGRLEVSLGADLFSGDAQGLFGRFDANDRLRLGLKLSF